MTRKVVLTLALALALALSGCALEDPEDGTAPRPSAGAQSAASPSAAESSPEVPASRCEEVTAALLEVVAAGAEPDLGPLEFSAGAAVRSRDYPKVWMLAGSFSAPGAKNGVVGLWATNSLEPSTGALLSVDPVAQRYTIWPDGDKTEAEMSPQDEGGDVAKECLSR